jgi:hypothetical protein
MSPSVIGSPARQYTPPSSNDEATLTSNLPFNLQSSNPRGVGLGAPTPGLLTGKPPPSSSFQGLLPQQRQGQDTVMSGTPASPPSSSEDSPSTSTTTGDNTFLHEDADMLDYDDFTQALNPNILTLNDDSSPEALFYGHSNRDIAPSSRFTSAQASPHDAFSPFNAGLNTLRPNQSSPEFDPDGDSPGLGTDMRGLRLNSRFPSPVQGTVRLHDVMMPFDDTLPNLISPPQAVSASLFDTTSEAEHTEQGLFQS